MDKPRIVVIGAGAIGGVVAALMRQAGQDVTLVCKHREIADLSNGKGLHLTGVRGTHDITVPAVTSVEELTGVFDLCLITTKAYDMPASARAMLPLLRPDSLVFSLQNGVCVDALAAVVGRERTVGCVIGFGGTMHGPGQLEMTSTGTLIIGRLEGEAGALEPARAAMSAVTETVITDNIYEELYLKLIINSCITSLGAICGLRLGEMLKLRQARAIFLAIIMEAMRVADALGLHVPPFGGKLDYYALRKGNGALAHLRRHAMIYLVGLKYKNLKSSSLQSLERGRPTEIDYFNGYIAQKGDENGVDCPVNKRLTAMVKEIENGKRRIEVQNLYDPAFAGLR